MSKHTITAEPRGPSLEAFLLGTVDFDVCLALQQRLAYEISGRDDGQIALVVCEHPPRITIGRRGSQAHVRIDPHELTSRQVEVDWVARGGGYMLHLPGQLAVYPIVPLEWHGFTVGEYLDRLQSGLRATLAAVHPRLESRPGQYGIWGRRGQLAAMGVAVRNWTTMHGAFINVHPNLHWFRYLDTDPEGGTRMTSLVCDAGRAVRMTAVRSNLVGQLTSALDCDRHHIYTGHPLLPQIEETVRGSAPVG